MQGQLEYSFSDLKCKLVINVTDGKILGNITDLIFFPQTGKILGFIVPGAKRSFFKPCENIFIPYNNVCKVGEDVILVELFVNSPSCKPCPPKNKYSNLINILDADKENKAENLIAQNENNYSELPKEDNVNDYSKTDLIDPKIYPK